MFKYYLMISVTVSLFLAVCLWLKDAYSFISLWCWVRAFEQASMSIGLSKVKPSSPTDHTNQSINKKNVYRRRITT